MHAASVGPASSPVIGAAAYAPRLSALSGSLSPKQHPLRKSAQGGGAGFTFMMSSVNFPSSSSSVVAVGGGEQRGWLGPAAPSPPAPRPFTRAHPQPRSRQLPAPARPEQDTVLVTRPPEPSSHTSSHHPPASFLTPGAWACRGAGETSSLRAKCSPWPLTSSRRHNTVSSMGARWSSEPLLSLRKPLPGPKSTYLPKWRAWVTPGSCTGHWCYRAQSPLGCASQGEY